MDNNTLQIKVKERLNKLASSDYNNLECWHISEAFNKVQLEWVRRNINPNTRGEADESSKMQIDDIQNLLKTTPPLTATKKDLYYEVSIPTDYLYFKRVMAEATSDCCPNRRLKVYPVAVADIDVILSDYNKKPDIIWGETVSTRQDNKVQVYTNGEFDLANIKLVYYRKPRFVTFDNCISLVDGSATTNVECEFKDDIAEILIDETVAVLAADMELFNQYTRSKNNSNTNE